MRFFYGSARHDTVTYTLETTARDRSAMRDTYELTDRARANPPLT